MGRGPVHRREASNHQAIGRQLDASWSGRICTWPVLTTDTCRTGSVAFIAWPAGFAEVVPYAFICAFLPCMSVVCWRAG
jgi:hypothetical protein